MATKKTTVNEEEITSSLTAGIDGSSYDFGDLDLGDSGLEGATMSMSNIPVMKLTQSVTPEVTNRDFRDIYAGMFINDSTKQALGEEITVRILRSWKCRTRFAPSDAGGQIDCACPTYNSPTGDRGSVHGLCSRCMYNNFGMQDHCQTQHHLVVALEDNPDAMYRVILSKTSFQAGRKLEKSLQTLTNRFKGTPVFAFKVKITAKEVSNPKTNRKWFVWNLEPIQPQKGEELIPAELVDGFVDAFRDITELRKAVIDDHNARAAAAAAQSPVEIANENVSAGQNLAAEMGFVKSPILNDEEVPF